MSISRRKDGRWLVKYKDKQEQWKQKSFTDETTARAYDMEQRDAAQEDERLSLGELALLYFRSRPDAHPQTKSKFWYFINGYEDKEHIWHTGRGRFLKDKYAEELNRRDLEMMREVLRYSGVSNSTINKYHAYISAILAWGASEDLIIRHPWRDFKRLKAVKPQISTSMDDLKRVYTQLPDYLKWAVETAFFLCLRPGQVELFGLMWTSFDWGRCIVHVKQGKSGLYKTVVPNRAYMLKARMRYEEDSRHGIVYVCHRAGKAIHNYQTAWRNACVRAGVKMRPYDIRHNAASILLENGADLAAVAAQLGHSSVATTGASYAHVTAGSQARAAELMPNLDIGADLVQFGAKK